MFLSHFCMPCEQRHWLPLLCTVFPRISFQGCLIRQRQCLPSEQRASLLIFQYKERPCLPPGQRVCRLTAHYKRFGFPQIRVPLLKERTGLLPIIKFLDSLRLGFLSYKGTHCMCRHQSSGTLHITLWELGLREPAQMWMLWLLLLLWVIRSLSQHPWHCGRLTG